MRVKRSLTFVKLVVFVFNDTATTEIYTLSLHDALPISPRHPRRAVRRHGDARLRRAPDRRGARAGAAHRAPVHDRHVPRLPDGGGVRAGAGDRGGARPARRAAARARPPARDTAPAGTLSLRGVRPPTTGRHARLPRRGVRCDAGRPCPTRLPRTSRFATASRSPGSPTSRG